MKVLLLLFGVLLTSHVMASEIIFIVNSKNPITELTQNEIAEIFLKKQRHWKDGSAIRFFDRESESKERIEFLNKYLKRTSRDIDQYWIGQKLNTGNSAPAQLASESLALALVARFSGAISYISSDRYKGVKGVKKIEIKTSP